MRPKVRRFGPVLLWQFGSLLLWLAALAVAAQLSYAAPFLESPGTLIALLLLIAVPAFLQGVSRALLARSWNGRPPTITPDFGRLTGAFTLAVPASSSSAMSAAVREGFLFAASTFTIVFIAMAVCTWTAWAWGYLRPKSEDEEPRDLPRGVETGGLRFIAEAKGVGVDDLGFRVLADGSATLRSALAAFTGAQLLPGLSGGTRTWSVFVDERPVAVIEQTWEHPQWWPPTEWSADPEEPLPAEGVLRLRVGSGAPGPSTRSIADSAR